MAHPHTHPLGAAVAPSPCPIITLRQTLEAAEDSAIENGGIADLELSKLTIRALQTAHNTGAELWISMDDAIRIETIDQGDEYAAELQGLDGLEFAANLIWAWLNEGEDLPAGPLLAEAA